MDRFIAPGIYPGYVVMPLKDYDELIGQIDRLRSDAYVAEHQAELQVKDAKQMLADTMNNLCIIERECFGNRHIVVHFNEKAMFDLAMQKLVKTFSEEELAEYDVFTLDDFIIGDVTLCRRKPVPPVNLDDLAPGAETL